MPAQNDFRIRMHKLATRLFQLSEEVKILTKKIPVDEDEAVHQMNPVFRDLFLQIVAVEARLQNEQLMLDSLCTRLKRDTEVWWDREGSYLDTIPEQKVKEKEE